MTTRTPLHRVKPAHMLGALLGLSAALGACTPQTTEVITTASVSDDYRHRHPIAVTEANHSIVVFVGQARGGLSGPQRADVMSGDVNEARKLLTEKAALRNAELAATERHLDRLREGRPETIETTSLHLDVLRDLRRIHSHICSVAYPVLDAAGELAAYRSSVESDLAALPAPMPGRS